jgi:hypothetical protein
MPAQLQAHLKTAQANASIKFLKELAKPAQVTAFQDGFRIAHAQKKQNKFVLRG